jgi:hypothetical protein
MDSRISLKLGDERGGDFDDDDDDGDRASWWFFILFSGFLSRSYSLEIKNRKSRRKNHRPSSSIRLSLF